MAGSPHERFLDAVEEEFGVRIPPADRAGLETLGQLASYVAVCHPPPGETLTAEELREHGASFAGYEDGAPLPGREA